jgi:hypothetical protein
MVASRLARYQASGAPFEEIVCRFRRDAQSRQLRSSPSGLVPCLHDGASRGDTLAIAEHPPSGTGNVARGAEARVGALITAEM